MKLLNPNLKHDEKAIDYDFINRESIQLLENEGQEDIVNFKWVNFEGNMRLVLKVEMFCHDEPLSQEIHLIDFENMKHYFIDEKTYQKLIAKASIVQD